LADKEDIYDQLTSPGNKVLAWKIWKQLST
jgi:hypothetical protein